MYRGHAMYVGIFAWCEVAQNINGARQGLADIGKLYDV